MTQYSNATFKKRKFSPVRKVSIIVLLIMIATTICWASVGVSSELALVSGKLVCKQDGLYISIPEKYLASTRVSVLDSDRTTVHDGKVNGKSIVVEEAKVNGNYEIKYQVDLTPLPWINFSYKHDFFRKITIIEGVIIDYRNL